MRGELVKMGKPGNIESKQGLKRELTPQNEGSEEANNAIAEGLNNILTRDIPRAFESGYMFQIENAVETMQRGLEIAGRYNLGMMPKQGAKERLGALMQEKLPVALDNLVASGARSVESGFLCNVEFNRQALADMATRLEEGGENDSSSADGQLVGTELQPVNQSLRTKGNLLEEFDRQVKEALGSAPEKFIKDIVDTLERGQVFHIPYMLSRLDEMVAMGEKYGVSMDREGILKKTMIEIDRIAPQAITRAVDDIGSDFKQGLFVLAESNTQGVINFLRLLDKNNLKAPCTEDDVKNQIETKLCEGIGAGVDICITSVIQDVQFGFPSLVEHHILELEKHLKLADERGVEVPSTEEIGRRVLDGVASVFTDGIECIISSLNRSLRSGDFKSFVGDDKVTNAHKRIDGMADLAKHLGIAVDKDDLHKTIDNVASDLHLKN